MKITLTMDEKVAQILMDATEFYGRVLCGQYEEISRAVAIARVDYMKESNGGHVPDVGLSEIYQQRYRAEAELMAVRQFQLPELEDYGHYGLGYTRRTDISYNIYQAVRYALAWNCCPEGGDKVDFNSPSADGCPIPGVEIDGKCYLSGNICFEEGGAK